MECDADFVGDDYTCSLQVRQQLKPTDSPPVIDSLNLVSMGPSMDYDVPTGKNTRSELWIRN